MKMCLEIGHKIW